MQLRIAQILILFVMLISACNTPIKTGTTTPPTKMEEEKKLQKTEDKTAKADSTEIKDSRGLPESKVAEDNKKDEGKKKQKRESINVTIALPMDGSYDVSRFAEFVNGLSLSAKDLASGSGKIKLNIVNIGNKNSEQDLLSNVAIANADIIVGGFQTSQVKTLAKIAANKNVPFISPWNTSEGIITDNPYYIQLKPSLNSYIDNMANYVANEIRPQIVYILIESKNSKENVVVERFTKIYESKKVAYKVIYADQGNDWKNTITSYSNIVINIPNWENKSFVTNSLQQINNLKKNKSIVVTGMPEWTDWDQIDFALFESLSLHIPSFNYVDQESMNVGIFNQNYFYAYNTWPTVESYYGNDLLYIVKKMSGALMDGKRLDPIDQVSGNFLSHYRFSNYKVPDLETSSSGAYFHNTYITIQKFEGGRFVPIQ